MKLSISEKMLLKNLLRRGFDEKESFAGQNYTMRLKIISISKKTELGNDFIEELIKDL